MRIFVDADACPKAIKEIIYRAGIRNKIEIYLVANRNLNIPVSPFIKMILVKSGFDEADNKIAMEVHPNDLVITGDIPLADIILSKGSTVLNPRGNFYTQENIKQKLALRNLMTQLREEQLIFGGAKVMTNNDTQTFANSLDKFLNKLKPVQ